MKTKAAIAWKSGAPLTIEEVDLQGPQAGEVLVEIKATGICHTDYYTMSSRSTRRNAVSASSAFRARPIFARRFAQPRARA